MTGAAHAQKHNASAITPAWARMCSRSEITRGCLRCRSRNWQRERSDKGFGKYGTSPCALRNAGVDAGSGANTSRLVADAERLGYFAQHADAKPTLWRNGFLYHRWQRVGESKRGKQEVMCFTRGARLMAESGEHCA